MNENAIILILEAIDAIKGLFSIGVKTKKCEE